MNLSRRLCMANITLSDTETNLYKGDISLNYCQLLPIP